MAGKRCILSKKNKQLLEEVRRKRIESEERMKILNEHIENLKLRVEETNRKMSFLL